MTLTKQAAEFLLMLLREKTETEELQRSLGNLGSYDWQALRKSVINQGLFSLFYNRLSTLKPRGLPSDFLQQFKQAYLLNLQRNLFYEQELFKIISHLQKYNIAVIALKGPIFARLFYQDLALRQAPIDIDLLVKDETLPEIQRILSEIDYVPLQTEPKEDFLQPARLNHQITQICLSNKKHDLWNFTLDIHTCVRGFFEQEQIQGFWQRARYLTLGEQRVLVPSNEDLLLYFSIISISLLESVQLRYLYDIHRLVTVCKKELDWNRVSYQTKDYNLDTCLYFPLALSRSLFSTEIPDSMLKDIHPNWIAEKLINLWIDKERLLLYPDGIKFNFIARLILSRYLYSRDWGDFLNKLFIRLLKEQKTKSSRRTSVAQSWTCPTPSQ